MEWTCRDPNIVYYAGSGFKQDVYGPTILLKGWRDPRNDGSILNLRTQLRYLHLYLLGLGFNRPPKAT